MDNEKFYSQPLPEVWKEILEENIPFLPFLLQFEGVYLAGGLLRTLASNTETLSPHTTDIDLFFSSPQVFSIVKSLFENHTEFEKVFQCPEDTLCTFVERNTGWKFQCIALRFYSSLLEVVESFDFSCICIAVDGNTLIFHKDAVDDTLDKSLRWNKITHPASSIRRMMKYSRKGYSMAETEYRHLVEQIASHSPDIVDMDLVYID